MVVRCRKLLTGLLNAGPVGLYPATIPATGLGLSPRKCRFTAPLSDPVAKWPSAQAMLVPLRVPSSTLRSRHRLVRMSHVYTVPSPPIHLQQQISQHALEFPLGMNATTPSSHAPFVQAHFEAGPWANLMDTGLYTGGMNGFWNDL